VLFIDDFYSGSGECVNGKMFSVYVLYGGFIFFVQLFKEKVPIIFASFFPKRSRRQLDCTGFL